PNGLKMMRESLQQAGDALLPKQGVALMLDSDYIMASLGVLATTFRVGAWQLMRQSLGVEN
ncbi:MAG TPA: glutamate mutase L, partial [Desulfosporosinus sp.]|nr:glutamate mutase L [Desulfosporosinus sp.]